MAKQFKKYGVDHGALYEAVNRDNRYHDDRVKPRGDDTAQSVAPPAEVTLPVKETEAVAPPVTEIEPTTVPAKPDTPAPSSVPKAAEDVPSPAEPPAPPVAPKSAPKQESKPVTTGANVQLRLRLRFPAEGVSPSFDGLAQDHGPELAFKAMFKRAFDEYRAALDAGSLPDGPKEYAIGKGSHSSTKMLTPAQYQLCMDTLDPKGLLPPMTAGRIIGERALALYFQKDRQENI